MLTILDNLPRGLLDVPAAKLVEHLNGPTLIHLQGRLAQPVFVSVLVHGNETVGWEALCQLLGKFEVAGGDQPLPRSLSIFIGNIDAAAAGVRHLPDQPDYNRIWPGCQDQPGHQATNEFAVEKAMMQQVVDEMKSRDVFVAVDLHNNTGLNPHYACINRLDNEFLHLATLFSRTVVFFINPCQVASMAMAQLCPSVTLECGKVGLQQGVDHAADFVNACLHLTQFPQHPVAEHDYDLFHTVAIVKIPEKVSFAFGEASDGAGVQWLLPSDIEFMNFRELPAGTDFGAVSGSADMPISVQAENGDCVTSRYFTVEDNRLRLQVPVMPSMLTTSAEVIRQDCLCYLMERYDLSGRQINV